MPEFLTLDAHTFLNPKHVVAVLAEDSGDTPTACIVMANGATYYSDLTPREVAERIAANGPR